MKAIKPLVVTDAIVTANNLPPSALADWSNVTAYNVGDQVKVESNHSEYICLIAHTNQDPTTNPVDGNGDPYWKYVRSTNDWSLFDGRSRISSVGNNNITVSLQPTTVINSLAVLNINASTLNVTCVSVSAGEVYNVDFVLRQYTNNFYDWFFSPIDSITNAVKVDLPAYNDMTITLTATGSGQISIGEFVLGKLQIIGKTQYGTGVGIRDYSTKDFDDFGNAFVVERGFANRVEYDVLLEANKTAATKRFLAQYRATPIVYVGDENLAETVTYGYYKRFNMILESYPLSSLLLEVEELI